MTRNFENDVIELNQEIEKLTEDTQSIINEFKKTQEEQQNRLQQIEKRLEKLAEFEKITPTQLRQELINGIRLLGERVSQVVKDVNDRFEKLAEEVRQKADRIGDKNPEEKKDSDSEQQGFGKIKESKLLEIDEYDVVPRDTLKKVLEISRRQSEVIKDFIRQQELKIQELEKKLEEQNKTKKSKRFFFFVF